MTGNRRYTLAFTLILFVLAAPVLWAATIYVKQDSPNDGPGNDWDHAFHTVTAGLNAATSGDEVWVAKGVYVERITLTSGVALYGGFAGMETLRDRRDWRANVTVLDGNGEGSVVTVLAGAAPSTRVDGFLVRTPGYWESGVDCSGACVIENNAFAFDKWPSSFGIVCISCSPLIRGNTFSNNERCVYCAPSSSAEIADNVMTDNGSAIDCNASSPTIKRNLISGSRDYALCFTNGSSPLVVGNTISRNRTDNAAIYCYGGSPIISGNAITQNTSFSGKGGGIYCRTGSPTIVNNIIAGNTAAGSTANGPYSGGGGICCERSSATIANNIIVGNTAYDGGGVCGTSMHASSVSNNIVAFNSSGLWASSNSALRNNNVYGNSEYDYAGAMPHGEGDISLDPLFVNRLAGDYHLSPLSPCIDAGWNGAAGIPEFDMDGQTRVHGTAVDIGADEWWASIADAKKLAEGSIELSGEVVTAAFPDFFYIESMNRTTGVRVEKPDHGMSVGARANVTGPTQTSANGERCIAADTVSQVGSGTVPPLSINNASLGGGAFGLQQGIWGWHAKQVGGAWTSVWSQACGLNNIGLLVRVSGKVTLAGRGWFYIDDGSHVSDGSGVLGIYVNAPGLTVPPKDAIVSVTGIASCDLYLGSLVNSLLPRDQADIDVIASPPTALATSEPSPNPRSLNLRSEIRGHPLHP